MTAAVFNLFGTRNRFCGRQFSHGPGVGEWFRDDSSALNLLCTSLLLLLHQLHLRLSSVRCQRLRTPGLEHAWVCNVKNYRKINLLASLYITSLLISASSEISVSLTKPNNKTEASLFRGTAWVLSLSAYWQPTLGWEFDSSSEWISFL